MKKFSCALLIGMIGAIIFSNISAFAGNYNNLQNNVLRLHILANSDSTEDQRLKLKVRDEILAHSDELFGKSKNIWEAEKNIEEKLERIEEIANQTIKENGFSYTAKAELTKDMEFESKVYDEITMPEGTYDALRITIGNADGHNWWCVMYPPLCLPVEGVTEEYFSEEEADILYNPEKYEVRFKCVEIFEDIKNFFEDSEI